MKDVVFRCNKCEHLLYVSDFANKVNDIAEKDCPECGEEGEIWILVGIGDYDAEYGEKE